MSDDQEAGDELGSANRDANSQTPSRRTVIPLGLLIGLWISGITLALFMWYSFVFLTIGEGALLGFFMGLFGIPVLIAAAILTVVAWFTRRTNRP